MRISKYIIFFNSLLFLIQIQLVQSQLTSNGLVLNLDASNSTSYSGSGATWNDISGNNNHFNINTATYNSEGYFVFDGDDSMTGPPSNSFGLSQTDHTIEIILEPVVGGGSIINFRGDSHNYGINAHLPWSSNVIYYDVGGCCDSDDRIDGGPNIVGQKTHVILRSKPSGDSKREVFVNGSSVINSGSSNTSTNNFTSVEATIGGYIYSNGDSHHTNSKIYSVRVYNRALTDQEISNNYNHYLHPNNIPVVNTHVTSGLVMYVDAENDLSYNGSGLSWNDLSGNNNNGTISGASYDSDRKSFDFDGNDDKVTFPAVLSEGDDTYTIEAYFKTDQNNKTQVIWEQNTSVSTSHRRGCMILLSDGEGGFNGQGNDRHDEIDYSAGIWNHWVIAIDNNGGYPQVEMYVNGVLHWQGNQANGGELNLGSHGSAIGYKLSTNGEYFNGEIKSVRIYNRKLNADEIKQNYWSTINRYLVTDGLQLYLDADNFSSFPGSGNYWYDLSQSNYDFTINSDAFRTVNEIKHMDFEGSYGAAQYIVSGSRLNVPSYSNATMQVFTSIKNTTNDHRTLVRGSANDHPVIIEMGNNNLGMHDNDNGGFIDTGFDITSLPNPYTQFNFLDFKLAQSSPYMKFKYNTNSNVYQITDPNANYHRGFHSIGKWFQNQNNVNTGSQWWGKIGVFLYYDRELTESETTQNFNAFASRFGLESETDNTAPEIFSSKLKVDNSIVSITFTEAVYNSSNGSGNLEASDFNLTISGGNATLSSSNPSSISIDGSTISLGIPLNGTPDGDEILTISPANNAIFDAAGNPASTSQTSNTIQLISDIVTSGLMIYLDASNENSYSGSGSNWYDLTSNGNDGVISGTTFSNDGGGSFEFGSSSDYVEIGDDPSLDMDNNQMTISYLIEIDRTGTGWSPAIEKGSGLNNCGTGNLNYYTWYGNTDLQIDFVGNTNLRGQLYHATTDDFYTGQFRLITITIDQSNIVKTYIDGEIKHTLNHNGQVLGPVTDGPLVIGKCPDPDGKIRSLMIYNRALSSDEVYQNYNSLSKAPKIISTSISDDNSTVSVTFDQSVYNSNSGSGNLETTDFSLSISGGTSTLSSSTPSSISISGDTIELGVPLSGSYDGNEQLTVNLTSYSVFNSIGYNASSQQISNTVSLNNLAPTDIGFQISNIPTDGLVLHLDAQNSNSNTGSDDRWTDLSSSGNDILFSNPKPLFTQDSNGVKILRTTNATGSLRNMVSAPTNPNVVIGNNAYTAISFFKPNSTDSRKMLLSYGPPDNNCNGAQLHPLAINNNGKFGGGSCGGRNTWETNSGVTPSTSQYVFQATSWDGSTERVYINGTLDKSSSTHTNNVTDSNNNKFSIGWVRNDGASYTMDADIGVILFYNRKLSDSEINDIYQNYNDRFTNGQIPSTSNGSVQEGSSVGTLVTNLVATDPDSTEFTFSLVSGDGSNDIHNSYFTVSGTQLLVNNADIDYETTPILNINLQVSDGFNAFAKAFTVSVTNINEAPTDISFNDTPSSSDLLLHLDSGENNSYSGSGDTWKDLSRNNYNGTLQNSPTYSNDLDGLINLNGTNQWIQVDSFAGALSNNSSYTINIWFKSTDSNPSGSIYNNAIFSMHDSSGANIFRIGAAPDSSRGLYYNFGVGAPEGRASNIDLHDNQWHNVLISKNTGSQALFYIDNDAVSTNNSNTDGTLFENVGKVSIGQEYDNNATSDFFQGTIPIVMIYDKVLSENDRLELYSLYKKRFFDGESVQNISYTDTKTISEGSPIGTLVGNLNASDQDSSDFTFSLVQGDGSNDLNNSYFTVSGTQLLVNNSEIDFETTPSLNIYVQASDGVNTFAKAFTVSVTDINEAPTDLSFKTPDVKIEYLIVGGGGGGGGGDVGAGGGAGGFRTNKTGSQSGGGCAAEAPMFITAGTYTVVVGAGGNGGNSSTGWASDGVDSSFNGIISKGGGGAPGWRATNGRAGGSGSGSTGQGGNNPGSGESCQGYNGGTGLGAGNYPQGGGGGAGGLGENAPNQNQAGAGGPGLPNPFQDSNIGELSGGQRYLAGGGGGGVESNATVGNGGVGGGGIGGRQTPNLDPGNGLPNTGGGGGGEDNQTGGSGGSGVVILRYLGNPIATGGTVTQSGGYTMHTFTQVGNSYLTVSSGGTSTSTASFDEGSAVGTVVTSLTAADSDTTNLTYSLATGNGTTDQHNSLFTVSGTQLLVASSTISYDTTTSLNINLKVSDGQNTLTKAFQITVNDVNRAPTNIVLTSNTITENASPSTVIGILSSVDLDTTDTTSFTLATSGDAQDDDNGSFTISGTSLIINSSPDYETKASYNIYINVNDGANNYAKAFTVSVTDINEAPTNLGITSNTINSDAFKFNGTNSYIEIPYADVNHPAEFTIELWVRLDQSTNDFQSPLSSRYGSAPWNNLSGYNFYAVNGLEKWSFTGGSGSWESIDTSPSINGEIYDGNTLKFGIWTHLASTYDGTTYRLYVNGILVGSKTAGYSRVGFNSIPARPLRIGAGRTEGSATYFFNGAVDEVRIWNYARTQTQINYNKSFNLSGQESGLVSYYQFESGTATNKTGVNGTNGTLYNSPTTVSGTVLFPTSGSNSGTVDEESSIGTLVGYLMANDPDTADLTYSLVSGDGSNDQHNSLFTVSGNQLLVAGNIDYETNSTLNIYVQVSDGENTYEKAMIINVNDVKEVTSIQVNDIIKTFGDADFDLSATSSNTGAFTYTVTDQNIATVNGSTVTIVGAGSTSITVIQAEDDNFASSTATFTLTVNKTDLIISLEDISKTYGDDDFNLSASSSSTGAYTYTVTNQNIATLNGNTLTIVGAGSTSITVSQAADNNYNTASKTINLSVAKGTPVLSFNDVVKKYGDTSFTIEAQSQTSSGSLTFSSSDNSVVSISGSTATVNGAGSSIITVTQSETANYNATTTSFSITVNKIDPTLSEFSNVTKTFGDPSFEITPPTKNNDNTGVFTYSSSDPSIASINNNNLTINGAGSVVLTANLGSDNNYNSGSISTNVTVEKANQTISIGALPENQPLKDFNSIPLSASSSSNTPIVVSLAQGSAASLSGGVGSYSLVSIQQTGIVTITFTTDDSNNPNYKTVSTTLSINVVKSNQSVSYSNNPPSQITYSENLSITLGASASSGLVPEYEIVSGDNASLNNNILSINDTGQITVEASQPGDVNYNPAVPITSIINVIQAPTTLSSLSVPNKTMQDDDFYLTPVVSNRPGDIIYTSSDPQVAIVSGTLVRIIGVGDATITATQNANSKYLSAEISANFTITIGDSDGDGIVDVSDNCDFVVNPEQLDTDGDGIGDLCDPDLDGDGVTNELDNCPMDYNPDQANNDNDSSGDICDSDDDNDGYSDIQDFFPFDPNEWSDTDRDGIGNNADTDDDNDKYLDTDDAFPLNPREWIDTDGDGIGNNKDKDDDNDGVEDRRDAFPLDESEHTDTDKDGIGNNSDQDDDGDGYLDDHEIECNSDPLSRYKKPRDYDDDMIPDCIDLDDDNDGCPDEEDILPLNEKECLDTDGDGIPDGLDFDADNDGILDFNDDFPLDPNESKDTDGDGIGDNEDRDDNNDGFPEDPILNDYDEEVIPLFVSELLTPNEPGEESVWKIINIEKFPSMNVKVYNPNGIIMFESWNYQNDWTGIGKDGKPLPTGPYFYRIDRANETTVEEGWMYIFN